MPATAYIVKRGLRSLRKRGFELWAAAGDSHDVGAGIPSAARQTPFRKHDPQAAGI